MTDKPAPAFAVTVTVSGRDADETEATITTPGRAPVVLTWGELAATEDDAAALDLGIPAVVIRAYLAAHNPTEWDGPAFADFVVAQDPNPTHE